LRYRRTLALENTKDLVAGHEADLRDTVRVTEGNTDLRRGKTLAGELDDVLDDVLLGRLEPVRLVTAVREGGGR
jgi:hypothetical protein